MPFSIPYMGTKRQLADAVASTIVNATTGVVLDAFSGMCTVAAELADRRTVWANDTQSFAALVASVLLTADQVPAHPAVTADIVYPHFANHREHLRERYAEQLADESTVHQHLTAQSYREFHANWTQPTGTNPKDWKHLRSRPRTRPFRLFVSRYAPTYFSYAQTIDIDSLRWAIHYAAQVSTISKTEHDRLLVALGRVLLKIATTTGHFAQYLTPSESNFGPYLAKRRRDIWNEFLQTLPEVHPIGSPSWRSHNRSTNEDCLTLLRSLAHSKRKPELVYADPPYTDDQYSRYYHLWETLVLYDYPHVTSKASYRTDRYRAPFSVKSQAITAITELSELVSGLGSHFLLSYPSYGLLHELEVDPISILRKYFGRVEICYELSHEHSTMGASKGKAKEDTREILYWAQ